MVLLYTKSGTDAADDGGLDGGGVLVNDHGDGTFTITTAGSAWTLVDNADGTADITLDGQTATVGQALAVDSKVHGVLSDGTTDDAAALNALIVAVSAVGGGTIRLPRASTTRINSALASAPNVTLEGHGWNTVISLGANIAGSGMIAVGAHANFTVRNLKLQGNRATYTATNSGVYVAAPGGCTNLTVENVWVDSVGYIGIAVLGSSTRAVVTSGVRIKGCKTTNTGGHGIICQWAVDNAWITDCDVSSYAQVLSDNCGITTGRYAYDVRVTGCTVDGTAALGSSCNGISLDEPLGRAVCSGNTVRNMVGIGIEIGACFDTTVSGNVVTDGIRSGIQFVGYIANESASRGVTVSGNVITRMATGIGCQVGGTTTPLLTPATKRIQRSRAFGLNVIVAENTRLYKATTAGTTAASAPGTLGTTVTGNTVTDGTAVWTDLGLTNSDISITGNTIRDCTAVGIEMIYAHGFLISGNHVSRGASSGIEIASSCNMFTIGPNDLDGNNTSASGVRGNLKINTLAGVAHVGEVSQQGAHDSGLSGTDIYFVEGSTRFDNRLIVNSTTPTVAFSDRFQTVNTASTLIGAFNDPNGRTRTITVLVADAFTTFVHTASGTNTIRLLGGTNYAAPVNTVMTFAMLNGSQWFEVSRVTVT